MLRKYRAASSSRSFLTPVWSMRIFGSFALFSLILAQTVFRSRSPHDFCVGFATGILIVGVIVSFSIQSLTFRDSKARTDVDDLSLTR